MSETYTLVCPGAGPGGGDLVSTLSGAHAFEAWMLLHAEEVEEGLEAVRIEGFESGVSGDVLWERETTTTRDEPEGIYADTTVFRILLRAD